MWSPDHPDPALGAALWAALSPRNDTAAFVIRVLDRAESAGVGTWRAVLGRWSRVAIAAAAVLAFLGGYLAGRARSEERRVGKECRCRWAAEHVKMTGSEKVSV